MELLQHLKCSGGDSLEIVFQELYICFNSLQLMENISVTRDNYLITTDKAPSPFEGKPYTFNNLSFKPGLSSKKE